MNKSWFTVYTYTIMFLGWQTYTSIHLILFKRKSVLLSIVPCRPRCLEDWHRLYRPRIGWGLTCLCSRRCSGTQGVRLGSQGAGRHQRKIVHLHKGFLVAQGSSPKTNPTKQQLYLHYKILKFNNENKDKFCFSHFNWLTVVVSLSVKFPLKFCIP